LQLEGVDAFRNPLPVIREEPDEQKQEEEEEEKEEEEEEKEKEKEEVIIHKVFLDAHTV
jgi:hypothetical protein